MDSMIHLNVGGSTFYTKLSTIKKHPSTRLGMLNFASDEYIVEKEFFFFDRNPELFNIVLDFYRNDCVHIPPGMCSGLIEKELQFWGIPINNISECCQSNFLTAQSEIETTMKVRNAFTYENKIGSITSENQEKTVMQKIWLFMEEPLSSRPARIYNMFYVVMVILSDVLTFLLSSPGIREKAVTDIDGFLNQTKMFYVDKTNPKEVMFATTSLPLWWITLDIMSTTYFTVEFIVRFIVCPDKRSFFKKFLNVLDLVMNISMMIRIFLERYFFQVASSLTALYVLGIFYLIGPLRLLRIFRISKQYRELKMIMISLQESCKELVLLLISFFTLAALFANMVYYTDFKDPTSYPTAFTGIWWAVVTMTTVGYGDVTPKTPTGKIVGGFCAITGLLILAMPMAIIASKFHTNYQKMKDMTDFKKTILSSQKEVSNIDNQMVANI